MSGLFSVIRSIMSGTISGNGKYTRLVHEFFENRYGFKKTLMTTSCTDALEMCAILSDIEPGDEVIMPSFTFVSTANAFLLRGARVVFADTLPGFPNIDPEQIESLVTAKTRAIVVIHYAGVACNMDRIMEIAGKHKLLVIEDAAHAIDSYYKNRPLGSIGHFATFSFHETKNVFCGEGGLLVVNDERFLKRAEIIWEKGTDRAAFYRGEVDRYGWVDIGSSFLPSDALASFLCTQLDILDKIQRKRISIWNRYHEELESLESKGFLRRPQIPGDTAVNGHLYYIETRNGKERDDLISFLKQQGIHVVFHYLPLHSSGYFAERHDGRPLPNTDRFSSTIVRLPFYYGLSTRDIRYIAGKIERFSSFPHR